MLGDKTPNPDFILNIPNFDFVVLTKTWNNDEIEISGFESFNSIQLNKKSSKPSGVRQNNHSIQGQICHCSFIDKN